MKKRIITGLFFSLLNVANAAETTFVNRNTLGENSGSASSSTISSDGSVIVFESPESDLIGSGSDTNGKIDIFAYLTEQRTISLVSVSSTGLQGDGRSIDPSVNATGRYVAFISTAENFATGDLGGHNHVYVHDTIFGVTTLVSKNLTGDPANGSSSLPSISEDGRYIAYSSRATDLVVGDTNGAIDIFVFDRVNGTTQRVSVSSSGAQGNANSTTASISGNGRVVAFQSSANNLTLIDDNGVLDVFKHDLDTGITVPVSANFEFIEIPGRPTVRKIVLGNGQSYFPTVNDDGSAIAFGTSASNLHGQPDGNHIVLNKIGINRVRLVSRNREGVAGNGQSIESSISADGTLVHFTSLADNLVDNDTNDWFNQFLVNVANGDVERVDVSSDGVEGIASSQTLGGTSSQRRITNDGQYVVIDSTHDILVENDNDRNIDIFLRNRGTKCDATTPGATKILVNNTWLLASLPCSPPLHANTVGDIFSDDIMGSIGSTWALFTYDSTQPSPVYEPATLTTTLESGQGFWILQNTGATVTLDMPTGSREVTGRRTTPEMACTSADGCFELLLSGAPNTSFIWNLIGNPYPSNNNVAFNDLRVVTNSGTCSATAGCTMAEAASSGVDIVEDSFFHYNGSGYITRNAGTTLQAWEGYWVPELSLSEFNSPTIRFPR